jgi:hypothetical protein
MYSIQDYVIKFVNDLLQICGFLGVLRFPPTNKTDRHDVTEILLKVVLNTLTHNPTYYDAKINSMFNLFMNSASSVFAKNKTNLKKEK